MAYFSDEHRSLGRHPAEQLTGSVAGWQRVHRRGAAAESGARPQLVGVYRARYASFVERLVRQAEKYNIEVALWALDEIAPALASSTRGTGPGLRLELLNRVNDFGDATGPLIVVDDDISVATGDLGLLLRRAQQADLSLAQPAHGPGSFVSHQITAQRRGSRVRRTRFVEVGPLVVLSPAARHALTPFPEDFDMGWGLDVVWSDLRRSGHHLGIVDDVTMVHHQPAATAYSVVEAREALTRSLSERELKDMRSLNRSISIWPRPLPMPLWLPSRTSLRGLLRIHPPGEPAP